MSLTQRQQGAITLAGGGLLMGTLGVFVEEARLGALTLVFFRCLFGFLSLAAYCAWKGYFTRAHFTRRTLTLALISGVLMVTQWVGFSMRSIAPALPSRPWCFMCSRSGSC